ncbi:hypothetical protein ACTOJ1_000967 [Shigella flexneri]
MGKSIEDYCVEANKRSAKYLKEANERSDAYFKAANERTDKYIRSLNRTGMLLFTLFVLDVSFIFYVIWFKPF